MNTPAGVRGALPRSDQDGFPSQAAVGRSNASSGVRVEESSNTDGSTVLAARNIRALPSAMCTKTKAIPAIAKSQSQGARWGRELGRGVAGKIVVARIVGVDHCA